MRGNRAGHLVWPAPVPGQGRLPVLPWVRGDGRGDPRSPGKAANLHTTPLGREALIEVVTCGRVGTEMPYFDKYAYEERKCRGLSEADLGKDMPPFPHSNSLTQREIAAVVDYIVASFVGK